MPTFPMLGVFGPLDWVIVGAYFALVIVVGLLVARRRQDAKEYFLADRSIPTWTIAISIVATSLSAATFVGVPDSAYAGDISYLTFTLGGFIAVFVVATLFVPRLYRAGTVTIYGYLAQRFGETARIAVSATFVFGRMLGSGARLFLAALPLCLLMFGNDQPHRWQMIVAICLIGLVGTFYTTLGGVRAVIWVDTIQFAIVIGAAMLTIGILLHRIPGGIEQAWHVLRHSTTPAGTGKLHLIDASCSAIKPYTLWAALLASPFLYTAAFGVDHDLAQRFLVSKSVFRGGLSVIASQFISLLAIGLFLLIGLLLFIFYKRPDVMGALAPAKVPTGNNDIYPHFLLNELPTVLSGLSIAGFFAIAQGSMDSAINALASSIVADLYVPLRQRSGAVLEDASGETSKLTVAAVGVLMSLFAIGCAAVYDPKNKTLLDFALGVLTFAFTGMLGVFLTALLTRRGNSATVIAALLAGAAMVALLQDSVLGWLSGHLFHKTWRLAWPWWMPIGTAVAFFVCICGAPRRQIVNIDSNDPDKICDTSFSSPSRSAS
jgi:SSS family solute:Na+ symporter